MRLTSTATFVITDECIKARVRGGVCSVYRIYYGGHFPINPGERIAPLVGKVSGVHVPSGDRFLKPATPLVTLGDEVEYEQEIGEPVDEALSIGVWASAGGMGSWIEDDLVAISGSA